MTQTTTSYWYRRMVARHPAEKHRVATSLELFFDLCFVVAVSQAASKLDHALVAGHLAHGVTAYLMVFFAIFWAWMNFVWFATAYDTDDGLYRLMTLIQMAGVLVMAAGIPRGFDDNDFTVITVGYTIMRLPMVAQWLRAARTDTDEARRRTARRIATGTAVAQLCWLLRLAVPEQYFLVGFLAAVVIDVSVPIWAERSGRLLWHPHHIAERFGLFTLIVLGESVLAATTAIQSALDDGRHIPALVSVAGAGLVIVFALWWIYFDRPAGALLTSMRAAVTWGYGHYLIFASVAAVGAGLGVAVAYDTGEAALSGRAAGYAIAVPVAVFLLSVYVLQVRPLGGPATTAFPIAAALVLLTPFGPAPVHVTALLLVGLVAVTIYGRRSLRADREPVSAE